MPYERSLFTLSKERRTGLICLLTLLLLLVSSGMVLAATSITLNVPDAAVVGGTVHITGSVNDSGPLSGVSLGITVKNPSEATYLVDQTTSRSDGTFSFDFNLPGTALQGKWQTFIAGGGATVNKTFSVGTASGVVTAVPSSANPGSRITFSGKIPQGNAAIGITVKDPNASIIYTNQIIAVADGSYSCSFTIPAAAMLGNWTVDVAGGGTTGQSTFTVQNSSGGGGGSSGGSSGGGGSSSGSSAQPVISSTGSAAVAPKTGGTISLGSVSASLPANALNGSNAVDVTIKQVDNPTTPAGFQFLGTVYEFTVGGASSYSFNQPVTLTFTFDPSSLQAGETPSVYYYDSASSKWVNLGGTVSGNTITVTVNHFTKFAVMVKETTPPLVPVQKFSDVTSSYWAVDYINKLYSLGFIGGYTDGSFKPDNSITRAEFVTMLVKAFKLPVKSDKVFADTSDHWAIEYISAAYDAGIVSGYSEGNFGPNDLITREQMAVMMAKAVKLNVVSKENTYADAQNISPWAKYAVAAVAEAGIFNGYPDNTFRPGNNATRAEAVTVIVKGLK